MVFPAFRSPVSACTLLHLCQHQEKGMPRLACSRIRDTCSRAKSPSCPTEASLNGLTASQPPNGQVSPAKIRRTAPSGL